ncbi:MAG: hypothetical protein JOZ40_08530, partial [Methylobacteriaceae bacterium]|nr:hypothetical protein [Methylobacteriaceae bacterium]
MNGPRLAATTVLLLLGLCGAPAGAADPVTFGLVMSFSGWFQPIDASTIGRQARR